MTGLHLMHASFMKPTVNLRVLMKSMDFDMEMRGFRFESTDFTEIHWNREISNNERPLAQKGTP